MTYFWAVMKDECGDEFETNVKARSRAHAISKLREDYPESRGIVRIESAREREQREQRMERQAQREYDDPHGYHYGED